MGPVIFDINGYELTTEDREKLSHPSAGGLILFSRNYDNTAQLQALVKDIRKCANKPFLISVDHEGGRVQRFIDGFTKIPSMASIQEHFGNPIEQNRLSEAMGLVMATELLAMDIDLSFAPVLDLNGVSEVVGSRSFGDNVSDVIRLSNAYINGMRQAGMKSTGKHFPGHGSVKEDSHIAMPIDARSKEDIYNKDMAIFKQLIAQQKLDAIMPAHVIYSEVDNVPAGFSEKWIKQILRQELAFTGVIFSDDLSMQGAAGAGSVTDRARLAMISGVTMVLVCNSPNEAGHVLEFMETFSTPSTAFSDGTSLLANIPNRRAIKQSSEYSNALSLLKSNA